MTAIPQFSKTRLAGRLEVWAYFFLTLAAPISTLLGSYSAANVFSVLQALHLLSFILPRIAKRQANPPYSFIFILVALFLWPLAAIGQLLSAHEFFKVLQHEASIAALILGVGARLIPGILGHNEIVQAQKGRYENVSSFFHTIPTGFILLVLAFIASYLLQQGQAQWIQAGIVSIVAIAHWRVHHLPTKRTHLTWSLWFCAIFMILSFILRPIFYEAHIHVTHAFFINGVVLISLLVATRVACAHGPGVAFENSPWVSLTTGLIFLSSATRVSAYFMPETYFTHLGYSSFILILAVVIWSIKFIPYMTFQPVKEFL